LKKRMKKKKRSQNKRQEKIAYRATKNKGRAGECVLKTKLKKKLQGDHENN